MMVCGLGEEVNDVLEMEGMRKIPIKIFKKPLCA